MLLKQIKEIYKDVKLVKGVGCKYWVEKGYKGRIEIFEILVLTEEVRELIQEKASSEKIVKKAMEGGMKTMKDDGMLKIAKNITSLEEIARILDV